MPQFTLRTLAICTALASVYVCAISLAPRYWEELLTLITIPSIPLLGGFVGLMRNGWKGLAIGFALGVVATFVFGYFFLPDVE